MRGMVTWQLTIDCADPTRLAHFWAAALGYEIQPPPDGFATMNDYYRSLGVPEHELDQVGDGTDRIRDPAGAGPKIWFQAVPDEKAGKNRLHLDLYPTNRDRSLPLAERTRIVDARVAELEALGASVWRRWPEDFDEKLDEQSYFVTMRDPEGNEFCVA
jgi:hypothetical protein